jgi:two-component system NtrC family sensor kinase
MKYFFSSLLFLCIITPSSAQHYLDSLQKELSLAKEDTSKVYTLDAIAQYYEFLSSDSNAYYAKQIMNLSEKLDFNYGKVLAMRTRFFEMNFKGNYPMALSTAMNNLKNAEKFNKTRLFSMALLHHDIGLIYRELGRNEDALSEYRIAMVLENQSAEKYNDMWAAPVSIAIIYFRVNKLDSALFYAQKAYAGASKPGSRRSDISLASAVLGNIYAAKGNYAAAKAHYLAGIREAAAFHGLYFQARIYNNLAKLYIKTGKLDSSIYYSRQSFALCTQNGYPDYASDASSNLASAYEQAHQTDSALKYLKITLAVRDSVFNTARIQQIEMLDFDEQQRQKELAAAKEKLQNQVKLYSVLAALAIFLLITIIQYRNNRNKQKANLLLKKQKNETDIQKAKVEKAYEELQSTQKQLVQSEKMASLGELTAGIAHEIQNPLNFVNNFSQVNTELIDEMEAELQSGHAKEAMEVAADIKNNNLKIAHHGNRADAIVKGMLQHSRISTGQKEPADINALADEYLRLSYHGLRAKDQRFNVTMHTDFDESLSAGEAGIGKINIVAQDIGRVLLNLYNNAFYSVNEKKKILGDGYSPEIFISTKKINNRVEINIRDNGNGIPQKIIDKIYQPFFTTKPTGEGTGLGLSLSYDIVKVHGGTITVNTKEGEGAEFIITLPMK